MMTSEPEGPRNDSELGGEAPRDTAQVTTPPSDSAANDPNGSSAHSGDTDDDNAAARDAESRDGVSRPDNVAAEALEDDEALVPAQTNAPNGGGGGWATLSVDRPVATFMMVCAVVVFGAVSLAQLPVNLMPEISYPTLTVRTTYEGAAPEEVEDSITEPIEELVGTVEGVVGVSSISRAGSSDVILQFAWNTNLDLSVQKVRERIGMIDFPDDAEPPLLLRYDPTLDPILRLALASDRSQTELRQYAEEELQPELEKIVGVAMVRVLGGEEELIRIEVSEERLAAYDLDISSIGTRLQNENVNVAGGLLYDGDLEYLVRTLNEFQSLEDIRGLVIADRDGRTIRLRDVASVQRTVREQEVLTRVDGRASIEIAVFKEADANLVEVAEAVKQAVFGTSDPLAQVADDGADGDAPEVDESRPEGAGGSVQNLPLVDRAPDGIEIELLTDQSSYVRAAIDEVQWTALTGGLFAVIVLFFFLRNGYATFVIGLAIPLSVLATFAPLRLLGLTLNIMSLGGLALGIGMLVDNAIVVLESIVRCQEEGDSLRDAAIRGTREVGGAVTASTLTTVAVFFPIVFVEGIAGQLFGDLAYAVVLSLVASLVLALFFVPMLAVLPARVRSATQEESDESSPRVWWPRKALLGVRDAVMWFEGAWARGGVVTRLGLIVIALPWLTYQLVHGVISVALSSVGLLISALSLGLRYAFGYLMIGLVRVVGVVLWPFLKGFELLYGLIERVYRGILRGALASRVVVIIIVLGLGYWTFETYQRLGVQLIPELHQGEFTAIVRLPVGTRRQETESSLAPVESELVASDAIARVSTFIGRREDDLEASDQGEHYAELTVLVATREDEDLADAEARAMDTVRASLRGIPGATFELERPTLFSMSTPLEVEIRGRRLDALADTAGEVEALLRGIDGVEDVRSSVGEGYPEIRVTFDRERLSSYGLDVRTVANVIRAKVQGSVVTDIREEQRSVDVELAVRDEDVSTVAGLRRLVVGRPSSATDTSAALIGATSSMGGAVTLEAVAEIDVEDGPSEIRHVDGQRAAVLTATTSVLDIAGVTQELEAELDALPLRSGQAVFIAGQREEIEASQQGLTFALLLAVFLVYVVMASKFESLMGPLVILLTIPLSLVGVVGILWILRTPVSVVVFIGVIVLAGIVVNNAIVLVDYILQLRRRGIPKREAIIEACSVRLRPVLITAATTVLGLIPMALGYGEGAEIRRPLAWVVVAGLSVSTLLTLIVIPVVYDLIGELGGEPSRRSSAPRASSMEGPESEG